MSKVFPTIYAFGWWHVKFGQHSEKLEMPTPIEKQKPPAESQQTQQWRLPKNHKSLLNSRRFFCQLRHVKFLYFFFTFTHGLLLFTFLHSHSSEWLKRQEKYKSVPLYFNMTCYFWFIVICPDILINSVCSTQIYCHLHCVIGFSQQKFVYKCGQGRNDNWSLKNQTTIWVTYNNKTVLCDLKKTFNVGGMKAIVIRRHLNLGIKSCRINQNMRK